MSGWMRQLAAPFRRGNGDRPRLDYRLRTTFEEMLREHFLLATQMRAAQLIADQGESDEPLEPESAERLARGIMVSDALLNAALILEEAASDVFRGQEKWFMVAAIHEARGKE